MTRVDYRRWQAVQTTKEAEALLPGAVKAVAAGMAEVARIIRRAEREEPAR